MSEPIPTPYDIVDIPHIAWEPSVSDWLLAVGLLGMAALAIGVAAILTRRHPSARALERLLSQLASSNISSPGVECERFSRLCRRIASSIAGVDLSGCTAQELRDLAAASADPQEADALQAIALIEDRAYAPVESTFSKSLSELCESAKDSLATFASERSRR